MRRVRSSGQYPLERSIWTLRLALAGLFGVAFVPTAAAVTIGAFEVRQSELRAPLAEAVIETAFDQPSTAYAAPITAGTTMSSETPPANPPAETASSSTETASPAAETSPAEATRPADAATPANATPPAEATAAAAKPQTPANATAADAKPQIPVAPASSASAPETSKKAVVGKIKVPRPGDTTSTNYYDGRAKEVLEAERERIKDNFGIELDPGVTAVICYAGCIGDTVGVVYFAKAAIEPPATTAGEMTQSAADGGSDAAQKQTGSNVITCMAGCYDDGPKVYPVRATSEDLRKAQSDVNRAEGHDGPAAGRASTPDPANDWLTTKRPKAEGDVTTPRKPVKRKTSKANVRPGIWLTRVERTDAEIIQ